MTSWLLLKPKNPAGRVWPASHAPRCWSCRHLCSPAVASQCWPGYWFSSLPSPSAACWSEVTHWGDICCYLWHTHHHPRSSQFGIEGALMQSNIQLADEGYIIAVVCVYLLENALSLLLPLSRGDERDCNQCSWEFIYFVIRANMTPTCHIDHLQISSLCSGKSQHLHRWMALKGRDGARKLQLYRFFID